MKTIIINKKETNYTISKNGKVFNKKTNKELKQYISNSGYYIVTFRTNGKLKTHYVHILVANAYLSNQKTRSKRYVNHLDCNKLNNNVNNLEFTSRKENYKHYSIINKSRLIKRKHHNHLDDKQIENLNYMI